MECNCCERLRQKHYSPRHFFSVRACWWSVALMCFLPSATGEISSCKILEWGRPLRPESTLRNLALSFTFKVTRHVETVRLLIACNLHTAVWNAQKSYFGDMKKKFYGVYPVGTITRHPAKRSYSQPHKLGRLFWQYEEKSFMDSPIGRITWHPAKRSYRQPRKLGRQNVHLLVVARKKLCKNVSWEISKIFSTFLLGPWS